MEYPLLLPDIVKKIENKLNELQLKPEVSPFSFVEKTLGKKHRYASVCKNKEGKKMIFYASLHKKPYERKRMLVEAKLAQYFKTHPLKHIPLYYNSEIKKDLIWITREYFPDLPIEDLHKIETLKRKLTKKELGAIPKIIVELNNLNANNFFYLEKFNTKKYTELADLIAENKITQKQEIEKLKNFIEDNKMLLKRENKYLTHGDFQIGNIIACNNKVNIIDLESAHINNFAFDISFFSTRLWQNLPERNKIIQNYLDLIPKEKKEDFKILFRIDSAYIGFHSFKAKPREHTLEQIKKRKVFFRKLLKACSQSFEELSSLS